MIFELKYEKSSKVALDQIIEKNYKIILKNIGMIGEVEKVILIGMNINIDKIITTKHLFVELNK